MTQLNRALDVSGDPTPKSLLALVEGQLHDRMFVPVAPAASQALAVNPGLALLASSATYAETATDRFDPANGPVLISRVAYIAYVSSASTLYVEQSDDNSTWADAPGSPFAVLANTTFDTGWVPITARYWRARITNNGSTYTFARLYTRIGAAPDQVSALQPRGVKRAAVTPVVLVANATAAVILPANLRRTLAVIRNNGNGRVYLGPSGVTATSPLYLDAGDQHLDDDTHDAWYGFTPTGAGGATVAAMEIDVA